MTTTVVSIAWGDAYAKFVPHWWSTVQRLDPAPDEIVIAHHPDDPTGVRDLPVRLVECRERNLGRMLNAAIHAASGDWIAQCPLDDTLTVDALSVTAGVAPETDLVVVGATSARSGTTWMGDWASIWKPPVDYRMNHHVPFKKSLWERVGGYTDHHWCDWAFFLIADSVGAHVQHVDKVTLTFGDDHAGARLSDLGGHAANQEIDALKRELLP